MQSFLRKKRNKNQNLKAILPTTKKKMPHQHLEEIHEADFLNDLLLEAGFDPQKDNFEELKSDIEPILMDRIMMKVFETLSPAQRKDVMKLFDAGKEAEALEKIENLIPNYDDFLAQIFEDFRDEYLRNLDIED